VIHGYMTLMRFHTEAVEAKTACAASIACLSERWSQDWKDFTVLSKASAGRVSTVWTLHIGSVGGLQANDRLIGLPT
jgi:hypothetical protein